MSASHDPNALASEYARGLEAMGCQAFKHYGAEEQASPLPPLVRRAVGRLVPYALWWPANRSLLKLAETTSPEVVWLFKGQSIYPSTVRKLRKLDKYPVAYNADHPFDFFSRGSGNENVANAVGEYALYMTFSRHIAEQLHQRYPSLKICVIPFGHSVDEASYSKIRDGEEIVRVCFLGNPDQHRAASIGQLIAAGFDVDVYGYGWHRFEALTRGARILGPVLGLDMFRTLRRYRVQLNFLRPHNVASHNMRSFEIPACGGIMLAEDTIEHREFFRPQVEAFYFSHPSQMVMQAGRLLKLSRQEADEIRARARLRSLDQPYSYLERSRLALSHLEGLVQK